MQGIPQSNDSRGARNGRPAAGAALLALASLLTACAAELPTAPRPRSLPSALAADSAWASARAPLPRVPADSAAGPAEIICWWVGSQLVCMVVE